MTAPLHFAHKGRGATHNVAHRFDPLSREPETSTAHSDAVEDETLPPLRTQVTSEQARSLIVYNDSPDIYFDRSINPYRGCEHGCIYCYARPTHSYLNLSPGLDFETKLFAKINAVELLRKELSAPGYAPDVINLGSATDAYQPIERQLRLTRALLEVLSGAGHPVAVVTKACLVERDLDLLASLAERQLAAAYISVTTLDHELARKLEPRASSPTRRLRTIRTLAAAGVPVCVNVAPVIPFVNEPEIERILESAADAGARAGFYTVVRLPWEVSPLFRDWLQVHMPQRAQRVMNRIRDMREGRDYRADFSSRMKGSGLWANLIRQRFEKACDRLGLNRCRFDLRTDRFAPPSANDRQLDLF